VEGSAPYEESDLNGFVTGSFGHQLLEHERRQVRGAAGKPGMCFKIHFWCAAVSQTSRSTPHYLTVFQTICALRLVCDTAAHRRQFKYTPQEKFARQTDLLGCKIELPALPDFNAGSCFLTAFFADTRKMGSLVAAQR
jgi:hypothetical protein